MRRTNPDSLRSCLCFRIFRLDFVFVRFHQAEIVIVKQLVQGRSNEALLKVE